VAEKIQSLAPQTTFTTGAPPRLIYGSVLSDINIGKGSLQGKGRFGWVPREMGQATAYPYLNATFKSSSE